MAQHGVGRSLGSVAQAPSALLPNNGASVAPGDPFLDSRVLLLMTNSHVIPLLLTPLPRGLPPAEQDSAVWGGKAPCPWGEKWRAVDRSRTSPPCYHIPAVVPPAPTPAQHGKS